MHALHDPQGHYRALGLASRDVTLECIKTAYRKASLLHHPDRVQARLNRGEIIETFEVNQACVNAAFEVLSDGKLKNRYDECSLHKYVRFRNDGMSIPSEFHSEAFRSLVPPLPCQAAISVGLFEAHSGCTKTFTINREVVCGACEGTGAAPDRKERKALKCERCSGSGNLVVFEEKPSYESEVADRESDAEAWYKRKRTSDNLSTEEYESMLKKSQRESATFLTCPQCNGRGTLISHDDRCKECVGRGTELTAVLLEDVAIPPMLGGQRTFVHKVGGAGNQARGHEASDLVVSVTVTPTMSRPVVVNGERVQDRQAAYSLIGSDVFVDVAVPVHEYFQDALRLEIPDASGSLVEIQLVSHGHVQTIEQEGKGMLIRRDPETRGSLFIGVTVDVPTMSKRKRKRVYSAFTCKV